jgi:soluble lytic murein transglycosylase-like protein
MASLGRNSFVSSTLLLTLLTLACGTMMEAPAARADVDPSPLLLQAMQSRLTVHRNQRSGRAIPVLHCRQAAEGCDQRLGVFAEYLIDAGQRNGIDPWVLAAMAFRESGMNPFAVGGVGELGILQLHPKNPRVRSVRFIKDALYRDRCRKEAGACQREVVDRAAEILAKSLEMCSGDMNLALGAYNTGKCGGNSRYAERILAIRDSLQRAVGLEPSSDSMTASNARRTTMAVRDARHGRRPLPGTGSRATANGRH